MNSLRVEQLEENLRVRAIGGSDLFTQESIGRESIATTSNMTVRDTYRSALIIGNSKISSPGLEQRLMMRNKRNQGKKGLPPKRPRPEPQLEKASSSPQVKMQFESAEEIKRRIKQEQEQRL